MGCTGEYSDRTEWPVFAFFGFEKAKAYAIKCEDESRIIFNRYKHWYDIPLAANKYDKNSHWDYTGNGYYVMEVEIKK